MLGQMDRRTVERSHFGGFGEEDEDEAGEDEDEVCLCYTQPAYN